MLVNEFPLEKLQGVTFRLLSKPLVTGIVLNVDIKLKTVTYHIYNHPNKALNITYTSLHEYCGNGEVVVEIEGLEI